ncbi:hypothetical protein BRPE64_ACDS09130 [Caballeronia insecticola]|uniref:Uncharacterized protein n=1 Tax=Caballeronia insecticola TaxID=758793 RepID=R4WXE0_9BURK|nr:hypothetical protein BRPE64_ACDS09130 [Caballeronia insecticola]
MNHVQSDLPCYCLSISQYTFQPHASAQARRKRIVLELDTATQKERAARVEL